MSEQENQPIPERSLEVTLGLHNLFSEVDKKTDLQNPQDFEIVPTEYTHKQVYPESTCDSTINILYLDPMIGYVKLKCEAGCTHKIKKYKANNPSEMYIVEEPFFMWFDEVGYVSKEHTLPDSGNGFYIKPQTIRPVNFDPDHPFQD